MNMKYLIDNFKTKWSQLLWFIWIPLNDKPRKWRTHGTLHEKFKSGIVYFSYSEY